MAAPMVLEGRPINGDRFKACVTLGIMTELQPGESHGHGNSSNRKGVAVDDRIEVTGASRRFLSPCNPDFNLIENVFSRLEAMLRKIGDSDMNGL